MKLDLMFREYCSLCHQMLAQLNQLKQEYEFEINLIDVDADPVLEEKYNELVPVLLHGEHELCHWHLDEAAVRAYLVAQISGR
ncbi:MAG: glutaredoxin family protein [Neisseria sp.]|nr:glutaredoxin family protein [Neisseria sp.]